MIDPRIPMVQSHKFSSSQTLASQKRDFWLKLLTDCRTSALPRHFLNVTLLTKTLPACRCALRTQPVAARTFQRKRSDTACIRLMDCNGECNDSAALRSSIRPRFSLPKSDQSPFLSTATCCEDSKRRIRTVHVISA